MSYMKSGDLRQLLSDLESELGCDGLCSSKMADWHEAALVVDRFIATMDAEFLVGVAGLLAARALQRREPGFVHQSVVASTVLAVVEMVTEHLGLRSEEALHAAQDWRDGDGWAWLHRLTLKATAVEDELLIARAVCEDGPGQVHREALKQEGSRVIADAVRAAELWLGPLVTQVSVPGPLVGGFGDAVRARRLAVTSGAVAVNRAVVVLAIRLALMDGAEAPNEQETEQVTTRASHECAELVRRCIPPHVLAAEAESAWRSSLVEKQIAEQRAAIAAAESES
ncbi:hypothetical protein [Chondromyces apiculatus]|uniref:Uncharacterized protein n=1 Tax=Chondromyces apiculatus DSM 436 TaxID=1192034 RepID=A0A017SZY7_9BACT|nr:hypothetical protein [Chondromyces apiculatus]EYF01881.1 Hypothetical protein CAP_7649 [Chondromyces apiculatus DSM 436]